MPRTLSPRWWLGVALFLFGSATLHGGDHLRQLQTAAIQQNKSDAAHWGYDPQQYTLWGNHSNRLIPVYTFGTRGAGVGVDLESYTGSNSPYRSEEALKRIYGYLPERTVAPTADYLDQTNVYDLQRAAVAAGKKHIFLVVFDGMDWDTLRAASIHNLQRVAYDQGPGTGTHLQDYQAGGTAQFGYMVTAPHNEGTDVDVTQQRVLDFSTAIPGGYDIARGGPNPWTPPEDLRYLISLPKDAPDRHAYTDSSSSASSMTAGLKTYNNAVNVDPQGRPVLTIAHQLQEQGWTVGVVTSVPISHATPAAAYSHNVHRDDYQDLTRDLLGQPSIQHPEQPLPGMEIVLGGGFGVELKEDRKQGVNFVAGNKYLAPDDLQQIDARQGGRYVVALRQPGVPGAAGLQAAVNEAIRDQKRLFGFYGTPAGNLPYQTADGDFQPAPGRTKAAVSYTEADLVENPTLAQLTTAAIAVAERDPDGFWLLVEAGDVDWGNHENNLDTAIGAVNSGDAAVKVITDWVEKSSSWEETLVIVTADHGHCLVLDRPELLIANSP